MLCVFILFCRTNIGVSAKNNYGDCKQEMMAVLCGSTVITHYNRKTYRIDDIDFSLTPSSTFEQNGVSVSSCIMKNILFIINTQLFIIYVCF